MPCLLTEKGSHCYRIRFYKKQMVPCDLFLNEALLPLSIKFGIQFYLMCHNYTMFISRSIFSSTILCVIGLNILHAVSIYTV